MQKQLTFVVMARRCLSLSEAAVSLLTVIAINSFCCCCCCVARSGNPKSQPLKYLESPHCD